jgi:hypothetical protein
MRKRSDSTAQLVKIFEISQVDLIFIFDGSVEEFWAHGGERNTNFVIFFRGNIGLSRSINAELRSFRTE